MQLRKFLPVAVLTAVLISGAAVTLGATAADAAPAISVSPSTGLHDGQVVTVSGSGFSKSATVYIVECRVGASAIGQCAFSFSDLNTVVVAKTDASGNLHSPSPTLKTTFKGIDCTKTPCEIAAHVGTAPSLTATNTAVHSISFGGATSHPSSSHAAPASSSHAAPGGTTAAAHPSTSTTTSASAPASLSTSASASVAHPSAASGNVTASSSEASSAPVNENSSTAAAGQVIKKKANNNGRYLAVLIVGVLAVLFVGGMAASGRRAKG